MRIDRRIVLRLAGTLLSIACVVWIVKQFFEHGALQRLLELDRRQCVLAAGSGALLYAGAVGLLALAWLHVQSAACARALPALRLVRIYCVSQFAKYLPGNVGHYVGRHVWARGHGIGHAALLAAAVGEVGSLVFAAIAWSAPLLDTHVRLPGWPQPGSARWVWLGQFCTLALAWLWLRRLSPASAWIAMLRRMWPAIFWRMMPLHLLFFVLLGISLYYPAMVLGAPVEVLKVLPAAAAISWLSGFLVLGAPAGIGVREVVFVAVMAGWMPESDLLALAAIMRVVTFGGDLMAFAVASALRASHPSTVP